MKYETKPMAYGFLAGALVFLLGLLAVDTGCQRGVPAIKHVEGVTLLADQRGATVRIERFCAGRSNGLGSGLAFGENHVLTVAHLAICKDNSTPTFRVTFVNGRGYDMQIEQVVQLPEVVGKDADGWARLTMDGTFDEKVTRPILAMVRVGERVCQATGYPRYGVDCGDVLGYHTPTIGVTLAVEPGNSGSPVYDSNGKLVGFTIDCTTTATKDCTLHGGDIIMAIPRLFL